MANLDVISLPRADYDSFKVLNETKAQQAIGIYPYVQVSTLADINTWDATTHGTSVEYSLTGNVNWTADVANPYDAMYAIRVTNSTGSDYAINLSSNFINQNTQVSGEVWTILSGETQTLSFQYSATDGKFLYQSLFSSLTTYEDQANKATTFATVNDTLYPSVEAVTEYLVTTGEAVKHSPIVTESGLTKTLALTDADKIVRATNASSCDITIPTNASVAFATGTRIDIVSGYGAGTIGIVADVGVTLNGISAGSTKLQSGVKGATLIKVGTNAWEAFGAIGAVS